jgi:hypothetical protein
MNAVVDNWRQTLLMELRMRNIPGARIGEIMAEVDSHCADSGEDPRDAFGDPLTYARSLDVPRPNRPRQVVRGAVQAFAGLGGIFGLLEGGTALIDGDPAVVSAGYVTAAVMAACAMAALLLLRRAAALPAVVLAGMLGVALPATLWRTPVAELPAGLVTAAGAGLFLAGFWSTMFARPDGDLVVDPRTGTAAMQPPRWVMPLLRWGLPAMLLLAISGWVLVAASSR